MPDYDFYRRLGSPRYIVAPMVDHSDLPFRMQTRKHGAQLVFTQMMNANVLIQCREYRDELLQSCEGDRPLIVQLCGDNPTTLLQAARMVQDTCDAIDLNLGCPQGIAKRGHYGAFLMEELPLLSSIVSTLVKNCSVPITCKTRIYKNDFQRSIRLCETLVAAGASMLTIHGRSREEKGHAIQAADWDMIARIKAHFMSRGIRIPIVANGSIARLEDVVRCVEITAVDGVMTSEAVLENPALFEDSSTINSCVYESTNTGRSNSSDGSSSSMRQLDLAQEYLDLCRVYHPPGNSMRIIRSHMMKFMHRYFVCHDDLRNRAAMARSMDDFQCMLDEARRMVGPEEGYSQSWYGRHMHPTHSYAGRGNPEALSKLKQSQFERSLYSSCNNDEEGDDCEDVDILGGLFGDE